MLREHIGYCGNREMPDDRKWIEGYYEMALVYLRAVMGKPPRNTAIEIVWDIVEQVDTPSLALVWHGPRVATPSDYIEACGIALQCFEDGIDWERIAPKFVYRTVRDRAASRLWAWAPECNLSPSLTRVLLPPIRHRLTWSDYLYFLAQRVELMIYEAGEDVPDPVGMIIQEFRQADLGDGMNGLGRDDDNDPVRVADVLIRDNPGFYSHLERLGLTDPFPVDVTGNNEGAREAITDTTLGEWLNEALPSMATRD